MPSTPPADLRLLDVDLASPPGANLLAATAARHGAAVAAAASRVNRLFLLRTTEAPGLRFVGGDVRAGSEGGGPVTSFSIADAGETLEDAFAACVGEGVERVAQLERPGDVACRADLAAVRHTLLPSVADGARDQLPAAGMDASAREADWVRAHCLVTGRETLVPADWCLRRATEDGLRLAGTAHSTGAAAGRSVAEATVSGLLELVERDAAALWWFGGQRGRPFALDGPAARSATSLLEGLRDGAVARRSWLLDITTDLGIPAVAALSVDAEGRGLAVGLAARLDLVSAARKALLEMAQMELANALAARKAAEGGAALDPAERRIMARNARIGADREVLHPCGIPAASSDEIQSPIDSNEVLAILSAKFARHGLEAAIVSLERPGLHLPTVVAIAPGLQQLPAENSIKRRLIVKNQSMLGRLSAMDVSLL